MVCAVTGFLWDFQEVNFMSKFYSILLDDEMHNALRKKSFETKEHISTLVRKGICFVLKTKDCKCGDGKNAGN